MKEHSGGAPMVGFEIPLTNWDEDSFPVSVEQFDFAALDSPIDHIVEIAKSEPNPAPIIESFINRVAMSRAAAKVAAMTVLYIEAKNPRMVAHQIIWATGMDLLDGMPATELAKLYGVSKQAFEQGALRICERLGLRPCRNMRSSEARENMRKRNYRKCKV